uniref:Uncharacterized protein n=1 Tax=Human herpesvirus 2 TaxID=10310 RepID=A0A481TU53_HHV2|nr:hypothetical protein [Human alphaherpesvirus 2]
MVRVMLMPARRATAESSRCGRNLKNSCPTSSESCTQYSPITPRCAGPEA